MFLPRSCLPGRGILWCHLPPGVCTHKDQCCWHCPLGPPPLGDPGNKFRAYVLTKPPAHKPTGAASPEPADSRPRAPSGTRVQFQWKVRQSRNLHPSNHSGMASYQFSFQPHLHMHTPPVMVQTTLQTLWSVSVQPNRVLSSGLSAEARVSAPSRCAHQQAHILGWEVWWRGQDLLCWSLRTLRCLRPTLIPSSPASEAPYLTWHTSQLVKEVPRVRLAFFFHSSLPRVQVPSQFLLFSLFPSSYPVTWGSFLKLWLYEIWKHSVGVLWELFHMWMDFLMYLWEEVSSTSLYL